MENIHMIAGKFAARLGGTLCALGLLGILVHLPAWAYFGAGKIPAYFGVTGVIAFALLVGGVCGLAIARDHFWTAQKELRAQREQKRST